VVTRVDQARRQDSVVHNHPVLAKPLALVGREAVVYPVTTIREWRAILICRDMDTVVVVARVSAWPEQVALHLVLE
jgi:hypothetical protein